MKNGNHTPRLGCMCGCVLIEQMQRLKIINACYIRKTAACKSDIFFTLVNEEVISYSYHVY